MKSLAAWFQQVEDDLINIFIQKMPGHQPGILIILQQ